MCLRQLHEGTCCPVVLTWRPCVVPVCDQSLIPLWLTVEVAISGHVCETTAVLSYYLKGVRVQVSRHFHAKKFLHFSESIFEGVKRTAPDTAGCTDTHIREKLRQIVLVKGNV